MQIPSDELFSLRNDKKIEFFEKSLPNVRNTVSSSRFKKEKIKYFTISRPRVPRWN